MVALTHIVFALSYIIIGLSVGITLPHLRGGGDPLTSWLAAGLIILAGALIHEIITRIKLQQSTDRKLDKLRKAVTALAGERARQSPAADPTRKVVMQEVKLLESMINRLAANQLHSTQWEGGRTTASRTPGRSHGDAMVAEDARVLDTVRDALQNDRIDVHLQPIVSLHRRETRYHEVFSRVRATDGTVIMPNRYLDVAKRAGLIATIDNLLLMRCIRLIRETEEHQDTGGFFCNISSATLTDADFMCQFLELMAQNRKLVSQLILELSQEDLATSRTVTLGVLSQLARTGFRFSMDRVSDPDLDINLLLRYQFRAVKMDCSMVLNPSVTSRMVPLRQALEANGIDLIVSKVETEEQELALRAEGFPMGQGYLYGEPTLSTLPS